MQIPGYYRANVRLVLLALAVSTVGCNYGFRGGGGFPDHVRTVFIAPFENETPQFDLDEIVVEALNEQLPRSLGVRLAGENSADAIIRGTVTRYEDVARNYRPGQAGTVEVLEHQVRITVSLTIVDVRDNVILFESTAISGSGEYRPDTQSDQVARARALETLIQQIVDGAQSQW